MLQYYDQTVFHRVIAGFMVQGGDPTGTGKGGESIYGGAFADEFHSRLRFNHRGLLAMANENKPNTNHSQFFFTLDACDFLDKKHTIFGKKKKKRERKATKDLKLLSFGDEEEAFQDEISGGANKSKKKKAKTMMSSHDLLNDRKLKAEVDAEVLQRVAETAADGASEGKKKQSRASLKAAVAAAAAAKPHIQSDEMSLGEKVDGRTKQSVQADTFDSASREKKKDQEEYVKLREELRKSKKAVPLLMGEEAKKLEKDRAFQDMLTPLQQQRQKYLQRKKAANRSAREQDTLSKLKKFQATLVDVNIKQQAPAKDADNNDKSKKDSSETYHGQILEEDDSEDDTNDDTSWMTAKLKFKKHIDVRRLLLLFFLR
ncbi:unnamed protein product [Phytophthora lilii]|uniref:Unnamed protein product n=1 Tax=Phytophthora lilii TaxID=2077276 RepID=A0A9W6U1H3_9STRA|nr:unnamed protein product [Phytophthora lilii]